MDGGLKVLVVEDEALVGLGLQKSLEKMGYIVSGIAASGEEAISMALSKNPDVVLMDIHIKGDMDGFEVSEKINSEMSVPIIFLSAYNDDKSIERCVQTGSYAFLTKPAGSQEIKAAIEIAAGRHRALRAEESMRKKESILKAVGFAAGEFLSGHPFDDSIKKTLCALGNYTGFERTGLYKSSEASDGSLSIKPFFFRDIKNESDGSAFELSALSAAFDDCFKNKLHKNKIFISGADSIKSPDPDYFKSRGIKSVLGISVFSGEKLWGFLCIETSRNAKDWSEGEKEGLIAAAAIIGNAIFNEKINAAKKKDEEKYKSLYNLLRNLCDNVPDMIWSKDINGRYTFTNRTLCNDILRVSNTDEPCGKTLDFYVNRLREKNEKDSLVKVLDERLKNHPADMAVYNEPEKSVVMFEENKKVRYVDIYEAPFCDESGKFLGLVGCGRDITKEKKYENRLLEINSRFTTFMDQLPAFAYIRDKDGNILFANKYTKNAFDIDNWSILRSPEIYGETDKGALDEINEKIHKIGLLETEGTFILSDKKPHTLKFLLFPISESGQRDLIGAIAIDITETKDAELNLYESEQKYRMLFENANDAIYVGDGKVCIDCNTKMCTLLGYTKDEILGHGVEDISPEFQSDGRRSSDRIREIVEKAFNGENIGIFEWQALKKSKEIVHASVSINTVSFGIHKNVFLIVRDITEKKNIEDALRKSELRYRTLVDKSPIGIEIFQDGKVVYANSSIEKILNMSADEITSTPFSKIVCPEDFEFIMDLNKKRHAGLHTTDNYKVRIIDKEGAVKVVDVHVVAIEWDNRPATLNFLTDITEKQRSDEALKESEERYRVVVENSRINILITQDEKFCYINPSAEKFMGHSNEELLGKSFLDFIYSDDQNKVIENHRKRLSGRKNTDVPEKYFIRAYNSKGELRTLDFNTTLIQWKGHPATLNFLIDITDQIESTKLIEKALAEKTILLQEVHHRVKNNLALINSLLSMQARNAVSEDVSDSLREAETRIYSIAAVHEGLYKSSSISTIPAGKHFRILGEEIIGNYSPDFRIKLDISANDCQLGLNMAIPVSLVVNELLTNSIKYAFKGREKGRVFIEMDCSEDMVNLIVGDDGTGVPEDFDLENTRTLGMTLVRNIVTMQLEGTIKLESGSEGTKWTIRVPQQ